MANPSEFTTKAPPAMGWGKLVTSRRNTMALAGLAALAALGVLLLFMSNYRDSVGGGGADVRVLVAEQAIDVGTSGDVIAEAGLFKPATVTDDEAVEGAVSDVSVLKGMVATEAVSPGEQLTTASFTEGADPVAGKLIGTQRALSISVDQAHGNIGQIETGSHVDVIGGQGIGALARDVLVLRAPAKTDTAGEEGTVVLRLSDVEASRVAFAADNADIWLTVRPPTLSKDSESAPATNGNDELNKLLEQLGTGGN